MTMWKQAAMGLLMTACGGATEPSQFDDTRGGAESETSVTPVEDAAPTLGSNLTTRAREDDAGGDERRAATGRGAANGGSRSPCTRFDSDQDYETRGTTIVAGGPGWWCCPAGVGQCPLFDAGASARDRVVQDRRDGVGTMFACPADWQGQLLASPPDIPRDAVPAGHLGDGGAYVGEAGVTNVDWVGDEQVFCIFAHRASEGRS
jgi:hypothetical protein